jgi:ABC-type multidrug transport system fused ATPase/permease subunit
VSGMSRAAWRDYARLARGNGRLLALSVATAIAQSLMLVPIGLLVGRAFDQAIPNDDTTELVLIGVAVVGLYFASVALGLWARHTVLRVTKAAITNLREQLIAKLLALPRAWFDEREAATLHSTVVQDSERLDRMGNALAAQLLPGVVVCTALGLTLLVLNPLLFVVLVATVPIMLILGRVTGRLVRRATRAWQRAFDRFSSDTQLAVRTITLTKVHAVEEAEYRRRLGPMATLGDAGRRMAWLQALYANLLGSVAAVSAVVVLVVGGAAVAGGSMTLGDLVSFYTVLALLRGQSSALLSGLATVLSGYESLVRLRALLQEEAEEPYSGGGEHDFGGALALDRVSFGYGSEPVLRDVSFAVEPGEWVALVGPNGAGKTTIVNLMLGLYRPDGGALLADGVPFDQLDIRSLRRRVGVVLQDPPLFRGTVRDNIAFGEPDASDEDVARAAAVATAARFIEEMPLGYDTPVGDEGELLSGGQRQRIAIARAMLREPRLLVLDEPSTSLDRHATEELLRNLAALPESPTLLLVTHDEVVARAAERTIRIRDGRIVQHERSGALV